MVYLSGENQLLNPVGILERAGLSQGDKVADLGCGGSGHFILHAAKMVGSGATVYAVDILKSVLQNVVAKARPIGIKNIKTIWSDLERVGATKIPADSLDMALLINTLYQSQQQESILKEAARLLKPSGKLLVVEWMPESRDTIGPQAKHRVRQTAVKRYCAQAGLTVSDEFQAGHYHYALVFTKQ